MRYRLDKKLIACPDETENTGEAAVEVLTKDEYTEKYGELAEGHLLLRSLEGVRHSKADVFRRYILGTLHVPDKKNLRGSEWVCGFLLDERRLIFVDGCEQVHRTLRDIERMRTTDITTPALALAAFLEALVQKDHEFIDDYEDSLEDTEIDMSENVHEIPKGFEQYLMRTRRELTVLHRFYKQLSQLGEQLSACPETLVDAEAGAHFSRFCGRAERLSADVSALREYTLQIRDMYQARIDVRHNYVTQILTILSAVFLPLTLLTGWYGMNFRNMPELAWNGGYFIAAGIAGLIIVAELIFFKIKKWL